MITNSERLFATPPTDTTTGNKLSLASIKQHMNISNQLLCRVIIVWQNVNIQSYHMNGTRIGETHKKACPEQGKELVRGHNH